MATRFRLRCLLCVLAGGLAPPCHAETWQEQRKELVTRELVPSGISHQGVIQALLDTPRHEFVPRSQRSLAYFDMALPIGKEQTISSPFIVAYMTQALDPQPTDRVLEIGTGSGYQAAILSPLVKEVFTIEIVEGLGQRARQRLKRLGIRNVHVRIGDGYLGWPEEAPFDKIIVTCSPQSVPEPLVEQLKVGGQMVIPVGERYQQTLYRYRKKDGKLQSEPLQSTLFVPMTGKAEQRRTSPSDPQQPLVQNGSFEEKPTEANPLGAWYYLRQADRFAVADTPDGQFVARFFNETPGRASHALQGLALDGRQMHRVTLAASVKWSNVVPGPERLMQPAIRLSFYNQEREPIDEQWIGPWTGSHDWKNWKGEFSVPPSAREAILRVGLFGATGELLVDRVTVTPVTHGNRPDDPH